MLSVSFYCILQASCTKQGVMCKKSAKKFADNKNMYTFAAKFINFI